MFGCAYPEAMFLDRVIPSTKLKNLGSRLVARFPVDFSAVYSDGTLHCTEGGGWVSPRVLRGRGEKGVPNLRWYKTAAVVSAGFLA